LIAQPVAVNAERLVIDVKDGAKVRKLEIVYDSTMENVVATVDGKEELNVSKSQAKDWLQRLVKEGVLEKVSKPVRYCSTKASGRLF